MIIPKAAAELFSVMSETKSYGKAVKPISGYMWVNENSVPTVCAYGACDKVFGNLYVGQIAARHEENKCFKKTCRRVRFPATQEAFEACLNLSF